MAILKDIKAAWAAMLTPEVTEAEALADDGKTKMTFSHTEGSNLATVGIRDLNGFVSLEVAQRREMPDLGASAAEMRYGSHTGFYRVNIDAGGHFKVSQDGNKVVIEINKGKETATATFNPMEYEILRPMIMSFFGCSRP